MKKLKLKHKQIVSSLDRLLETVTEFNNVETMAPPHLLPYASNE